MLLFMASENSSFHVDFLSFQWLFPASADPASFHVYVRQPARRLTLIQLFLLGTERAVIKMHRSAIISINWRIPSVATTSEKEKVQKKEHKSKSIPPTCAKMQKTLASLQESGY